MSGHGGARAGAGRPKGSGSTVSKMDRHRLSEMICSEAEDLVRNLLDLALSSKDDRLRLQATIALLDRAYGRPHQAQEVVEEDEATKLFGIHFGRHPNTGRMDY